jgi:hypothetical protein
MKTSNTYPAERQSDKAKPTSFDKMEAICCGVQARFEESTGYSKKVTDETINVARALGVADTEIERWATHRLSRLARDTERLKKIKFLLSKVYGNGSSPATSSSPGA